jgi:hypothetical protein
MTINSIKNFGIDLVKDTQKVVKSLYKNEQTHPNMLATSVALRAIGALSALYGTAFLAKSLLGLVSLNPVSSIAAPLFLATSIALFIITHEAIKIGYNLRNLANDVQKSESDSVFNNVLGFLGLAFKRAKEQVNETPTILDGTLIGCSMKHFKNLSEKVSNLFA